MRDKIFEAIKAQSGNITFNKLAKKFDIDTFELKRILLELKLDGKILQLGNKYMLFPNNLLRGTILCSDLGSKFIVYKGKNINVSSNFFNDVILNDVVAFKINSRNEAEIVSIIDRPLGKITCEVISNNGKKEIIPYHEGIRIYLPKDIMNTLYDGDVILVDVIPTEIGEYQEAKFIKKIGRIDDPCMADYEIGLNYGFDNDYSDEYMAEVNAYPTSVNDEEIKGRCDFRSQKSVTIDCVNTKDMDDGVYAEVIDNDIIRVYVHIADVSHYVKYGSEVFKRACEKTTSAYINNSVFHMLHHIISNGICSLNPNVDRLTKTVIMDIDKNGNIVNYNVVKSVINSKKKMDYDSVDKILVDNEIPNGYGEYISQIRLLDTAAKRLQDRFIRNGKLEFGNNESRFEYNKDGSLKDVLPPTYSPSGKIIENLMVAANETVANWLFSMGIPAIFRILEEPDANKINKIIDKLNQSGFNIKHVGDVGNSSALQKIIDKVRNSDKFPLISEYLIMGMQRARYSVFNVGHYALGLEAYLHFTSPIRRLADLIVHMITDLVLDDYKIFEYDLEQIEKVLEELAVKASIMERQADKAEYDGKRRIVIQKLEKLKGQEFEAMVCDVDKKIRIKLFDIDTYITENDLGPNFKFDSSKKYFYDSDINEYLYMGTLVLVKLVDANVANRSFKVNVLGIINNNVKKKTLIK